MINIHYLNECIHSLSSGYLHILLHLPNNLSSRVPSRCTICLLTLQFSLVQLLSCVRLFETQASLSITSTRSSLKLTCIESVMPSSHLILSHPLLLLPPIPPSIRVFSNESTLRMRWSKYWSFSFSIKSFQRTPKTDLL